MNKLKNAWKSWTVWINGASLALIAALPMLQDTLPQIQSYVSPSAYRWAMLALIVANLVLRFKTTSSLADK